MSGRIGIVNPGSLCYVNVCIHLLHKIEPIKESVLNIDSEKSSEFLNSLKEIFLALDNKKEPPDSSQFYLNSKYGEKSILIQEDAREFLEFILDKINAELGNGENKELENFIYDMFSINTQETTTADELNDPVVNGMEYLLFYLPTHDSTNFEEAIYRVLYSTFEFRISEEHVLPLEYVEAEKEIKFVNPPPVLIFSINRFRRNELTHQNLKDQRQFDFPLELDLSPFSLSFDQNEEQYFLYSIIAHSGHANGGHYLYYVRHDNYVDWICFNDSVVSIVSENEIKALFGPGSSINFAEGKAHVSYSPVAYQLIFIKKSFAPEICPHVKIPLSSPLASRSPSPAPAPLPPAPPSPPNPNDPEEKRTKDEIEKSVRNFLAEFFEMVGDLIQFFKPEELLKLFEEFLHKRLKFPQLSYVPKNKINPELFLDIEDQQHLFDYIVDDEIAKTVADYIGLDNESDSNPLIENSNKKLMDKMGKVIDISDQDTLGAKFLDKIQIDLLKNKNNWKKVPDNPLFPGVCRLCRKKKQNCWIVEEDGLNYLCDDCRIENRPKPKKAPSKTGAGAESKSKSVTSEKKGKKTQVGQKKKRASRKKNAGEKLFKCIHQGCDKAFTCASHLNNHQISHSTERPYKCGFPGCDFSCKSKWDLNNHQRAHSTARPYKCGFPGCEKAFKNNSNLKDHQVVHSSERPYKCVHPGCDSAFSLKKRLTSHVRVHSTERLFKCQHPGCNKAFMFNSHLSEHKLVHSTERLFTCDHPGCSASLKTKSSLNKHKLVHSRVKSFKCGYLNCNAAFSRKADLKTHKMIHSGTKPFNCTFSGCTAAFAQLCRLKRHQLRHSGVKAFKCNLCNEAFIVKCDLQRHQVRHSGVKAFKCNLCNEAFFLKFELNKHEKSKYHIAQKSKSVNKKL